jgi:cell wall assembly regulator SMI1
MLDLDPAPGGVAGQVIQHWHDDASQELLAPSYRAWLEAFADALDAGEYVLTEEYFGLVHRDDVL